jgi:ribosomal protein S18 acetylase RimI-like enzyme
VIPPFNEAGRLGIAARPMTDDDLPFVAALYASTRQDELATSGWPAETIALFLAQQHEAQHRHYRHYFPDAKWLILERGGEAVGRLYLRQIEGRLHIIDISLVPAARNQGAGSAILRDLLGHARGRGEAVSIHVEKFNPARRLYARLGFEEVEDRGAYDLLVARAAEAS